MIVRHTASFKLNRELEHRLREATGAALASGCWPYDPEKKRQIEVEMNGGARTKASVMRIVWALARVGQHLTKHDEALHSCGNTGAEGTDCCCVNPDHIMKGDQKVRLAMTSYTARSRRKAA